MTREEKIKLINSAREDMRSQYNQWWEYGNEGALARAGHLANIISALIADLD